GLELTRLGFDRALRDGGSPSAPEKPEKRSGGQNQLRSEAVEVGIDAERLELEERNRLERQNIERLERVEAFSKQHHRGDQQKNRRGIEQRFHRKPINDAIHENHPRHQNRRAAPP